MVGQADRAAIILVTEDVIHIIGFHHIIGFKHVIGFNHIIRTSRVVVNPHDGVDMVGHHHPQQDFGIGVMGVRISATPYPTLPARHHPYNFTPPPLPIKWTKNGPNTLKTNVVLLPP